MFISKNYLRTFNLFLASLLCVTLVAAACGGEEEDAGPTDVTSAPTTEPDGTTPDDGDDVGPAAGDMTHLGDGSLGVVAVEAGDAIQIRSLNAITGDVAFFGLPIERAVVLAVEDYGQIHGLRRRPWHDAGRSLLQRRRASGGADRRG